MTYIINQISAAQTWPIRHKVMWPEYPLDFVKIKNDEEGLHFGLWLDAELVSVISLFIEGQEAQFRKFATLEHLQGKGLGTALLSHLIDFSKKHKVQLLWCHARTSALPFYQKFGLDATGDTFVKEGIEYVKMEIQL